MANINKNANYSGIPGGWRRGGAYPLDPTEIFYSLTDAQNYAQTDVTSYVGQIIQVVDEANNTATAYIITNLAGDLEEIGSGGSSTLVVATKADLNDPEKVANDLTVGQVAYASDEHTSYILESIGDAPPTSYVWSEMASSDTTWAETENPVIFYALIQSAYDTKASSPDTNFNNTLFFVTDTGRVYKGAVDVSNSLIITDTIPEINTAIKNKLYLNNTTYEAKITADGINWINMSPGYLTDGTNWAEADSNKFATIGLIKKGIQEAVNGKLDKLSGTTTDAGKVAVITSDGTGIEIGTVKLTDLATTAQLDNKVDKVAGTENDIVIFGAEGAIVDSGKKIGGATLAETPDANTLATEAAVNSAISWQLLPIE